MLESIEAKELQVERIDRWCLGLDAIFGFVEDYHTAKSWMFDIR
jgi:hypothetical protein